MPSSTQTSPPGGARRPWLVVVDLQEIFTDPDSPWGTPEAAALAGPVTDLARSWGPEVVLTRFVAPPGPQGAWVEYYRRWPFALQPPDAPAYRLVPGLPDAPVVDATTFSKWGPAFDAATGVARDLVVCGVATDCCVLATVVAAVDAGARVAVVTDGCAGASPAAHDAALTVLAGFAPQVGFTTLEAAMAGLAGTSRPDRR